MARTCTVDGCDRRHKARGWCNLHYLRWRDHGDPLADLRPRGESPGDGLKHCPGCDTIRPRSEFDANRTRKDGRNGHCKRCMAAWRAANRPALLEARRRWYRDNRDEAKAARARWRRENTDRNRAIARAASAAHLARKRNADGTATAEQIAARWDYWGGRCWMCGDDATESDHVKPLSAGGANWPANLRPACKPCNQGKSGTWPWRYADDDRPPLRSAS